MRTDATARLSWSERLDREEIGLNLMAAGRSLAMEWLLAATAVEKHAIEGRVTRLLVRLATLEVADCRDELLRKRRQGARLDQLCISTLGRMSDALDGAHGDYLAGGDGKAYVWQAICAAKSIMAEGLAYWYSAGPMAGLLLIADLLDRQTVFDFGIIDDLQAMSWVCREIPMHADPLGPEGKTFRDLYQAFVSGQGRGLFQEPRRA